MVHNVKLNELHFKLKVNDEIFLIEFLTQLTQFVSGIMPKGQYSIQNSSRALMNVPRIYFRTFMSIMMEIIIQECRTRLKVSCV